MIYLNTHNLLIPWKNWKMWSLHWFTPVCSYAFLPLWGIHRRRPISQLDQIKKPGITERMLRLWFSTPPFCVYSCVTLQAANYGLILIIMDFVFSTTSHIWPIRQKRLSQPKLTKKCIVIFWQVLEYLLLQSLVPPPCNVWQFETYCSTAKCFPCAPNREWCIEMPGVCCWKKEKKWHQFNKLLPFKKPY